MTPKRSRAAELIGSRIRFVRNRIGLSLEDLGQLAEMSWTSIGKIERGDSSPTAESLIKLATALDINPAAFLHGLTADDYEKRPRRLTARAFIEEKRGKDDPRLEHLSQLEQEARAQLEALRLSPARSPHPGASLPEIEADAPWQERYLSEVHRQREIS